MRVDRQGTPLRIVKAYLDHRDVGYGLLSVNNRLYSLGVVISEWVGDTVVIPGTHLKYSGETHVHRDLLVQTCERAGITVHQSDWEARTARKEVMK